MPKASQASRKYVSYEDYRRTFFPKAKNRRATSDDPAMIGTELAKQALRKLRLAIS